MLDYFIIYIITAVFIKGNLRRGYKLSIILGIIMVLHLALYTIIVELIKITYEPFSGFAPNPKLDLLRYVLIGMAILSFFFFKLIRYLSIKRPIKHNMDIKKLIHQLIYLSLFTYAICESVAIYGLVLFLMAGSSLDYYLFLFPCIFFLYIYFPRYSEWEDRVKQLEERQNKETASEQEKSNGGVISDLSRVFVPKTSADTTPGMVIRWYKDAESTSEKIGITIVIILFILFFVAVYLTGD
jgi:hypothetical protein